jgi:hypothetical protein
MTLVQCIRHITFEEVETLILSLSQSPKEKDQACTPSMTEPNVHHENGKPSEIPTDPYRSGGDLSTSLKKIDGEVSCFHPIDSPDELWSR